MHRNLSEKCIQISDRICRCAAGKSLTNFFAVSIEGVPAGRVLSPGQGRLTGTCGLGLSRIVAVLLGQVSAEAGVRLDGRAVAGLRGRSRAFGGIFECGIGTGRDCVRDSSGDPFARRRGRASDMVTPRPYMVSGVPSRNS